MREADRIYIALLSSDTADASPGDGSFLLRVNADGSIPAQNPVGSVYVSIPNSPLPLAVTWGPDDELPWRVESAGLNTYVLTRRGTAIASRPFTAPATPVAIQIDALKRLLVVDADGRVTRFTRTSAGWTIGATRAASTTERTGNALLFPDGDLITCGTDQGARYVVRRGSVPE
jgi:YD repeat-containing protein